MVRYTAVSQNISLEHIPGSYTFECDSLPGGRVATVQEPVGILSQSIIQKTCDAIAAAPDAPGNGSSTFNCLYNLEGQEALIQVNEIIDTAAIPRICGKLTATQLIRADAPHAMHAEVSEPVIGGVAAVGLLVAGLWGIQRRARRG
jgi:hypothetical protein